MCTQQIDGQIHKRTDECADIFVKVLQKGKTVSCTYEAEFVCSEENASGIYY